ncbi:MAG: hypothetical protein JWQ01_2865 [Massilia sp.]|nr:hypothetical protein [Massilia sp.]
MNGEALSDLLLALVSLPLAWRLRERHPGIGTAFLLIGVAALCGVVRYIGVPQALGPHRFFSLLAACAAMPLLAASLCWPTGASARRAAAAARFVLLAGGIGVLLVAVAGIAPWSSVAAALSALAIAASALRSRRPLAIAASVALVAAFAAGAAGAVQPLHILMALSLALMGWEHDRGTQYKHNNKETYE